MNLRKYLPIENFTLTTSLTLEQIIKRLENNVELKKKSFFYNSNRNSEKPFEGFIKNNLFVINRIINYQNSFLPIISGEIIDNLEQPILKINMRLSKFTGIFISFWLGIVSIVCFILLLFGILSIKHLLKSGFSPFLLIPFVMLIFGFALTFFAFKHESKIAKRFLIDMLKAKEVE